MLLHCGVLKNSFKHFYFFFFSFFRGKIGFQTVHLKIHFTPLEGIRLDPPLPYYCV